MPQPTTRPVHVVDYSKITLQQLINSKNKTIRRNIISIMSELIRNK